MCEFQFFLVHSVWSRGWQQLETNNTPLEPSILFDRYVAWVDIRSVEAAKSSGRGVCVHLVLRVGYSLSLVLAVMNGWWLRHYGQRWMRMHTVASVDPRQVQKVGQLERGEIVATAAAAWRGEADWPGEGKNRIKLVLASSLPNSIKDQYTPADFTARIFFSSATIFLKINNNLKLLTKSSSLFHCFSLGISWLLRKAVRIYKFVTQLISIFTVCVSWSSNGRTEFVRIGMCQNPFLPLFEEIGICWNQKLSELEIVRTGICQNWKLLESEFVSSISNSEKFK